MKEFRNGKGVTEHYSSLEEMAKAWNIKPANKRTKNEEELKAQQEKFLGKCRSCGQLLSFVKGSNVVCCKNEKCRGINISKKGEEPRYIPVTRTLDEKGIRIAEALFE